MSGPLSSGLLRGGLILIDPSSGAVQRVISLQYNPETLTRSLQPQATESSGPFSEPLRLKGPPTETFKLDAEIDATDQLEFPDQHPKTVSSGIHPQLAALETIVYPDSDTLIQNNTLLSFGTLEIAPTVAPLTLFVWSKERVVPVRITDFSITEEAFDSALNPIRAKVSLSLKVLHVGDLGFNDKGGHLILYGLSAAQGTPGGRCRPRQPGLAGIEWTAMSIERFPPNSRYNGVPTAELTGTDGEKIVYLRRRFIPDPATLVPVGEVQVQGGDRLDRLAATNLGDPIQFWRIADGNGAQVPSDLERPGDTLRLTLPAGLGGGGA
jgi:hypothetical protein